MTNTITDFLPQLAAHPDVRDLVQAHFGEQASQVLQGMEQGSLSRDQSEELNGLVNAFIVDHGEEVASFEGLATTSTRSDEAMRYFEADHPEAHHLIQTQAKELERLLGKDQAAVALGQKREPFYIKVLCWGSMYIVMADEFEEQWFNNKEIAIAAAQSDYEPFIKNFSKQDRLANRS